MLSDRSESDRLQKLENAVRQLQQRNEALESEVHQLRAKGPFAPAFGAQTSSVTPGNDNKAVFAAPPPPPVDVHPAGSEYKLTLGGYIQANFEDGDVSAFEGRFGATALKDRFRLRRARITLDAAILRSSLISRSKATSSRATPRSPRCGRSIPTPA